METKQDYDLAEVSEGRPCLTLRGVSRSFGGLKAVNQVDLEVQQGARRAIIGPNGAGKTTLFNLLAGQLLPTSGRVLFFGEDITNMPPHRRAYLGIARTFQITNLFFNLTVMDNISLAAQALKKMKFNMLRPAASYKQIYSKVDEVLERVKIAEKKKVIVKNLSYGEQRQIEVGMALLGEPRLLLLDEPTAGLAPAESALMVSILKTLSDTLTVLIIEHDMDVAFELSDLVTVFHYGQILAEGTKEEIQSNENVQRIYLRRR